MQVRCPNCGKKVNADNINIQKMTAVCAACDTVFPFDLPEVKAKTKWRDVRQPDKLVLRDAETLRMEFATNFRLEQDGDFIVGMMGAPGLMVLALWMLNTGGEIPVFLPIVLLFLSVICFYWLALNVLNKTHIEMDADSITVERKPFPNPFREKVEIPLDSVTTIKYEETAISKKEAYDTPRYRVWAETTDGISRTIVNDVIEDYAVFVAQTLEQHLYMESEPDVSRLEDDSHGLDDDADVYEVLRKSRNNLRS
jgi:hypothetical protein